MAAVFFICLAFMISTMRLISSEQTCGSFNFFPPLTDSVLTLREDTEVVLRFEQVQGECTANLDKAKITILKKDGNHLDVCSFLLVNDTCVPRSVPGARCTCLNESGIYEFRKNVSREDSLVWTWTSSVADLDKGETKAKTITFDVTYPPVITNLSLSSGGEVTQESLVVDENSTVLVDCHWENGNPTVTARLLDRRELEMASSNRSGQIVSSIGTVGCTDAGIVRCEAPGASVNRSATLLVKCPPHFIDANLQPISMVTNQIADVTFRVRTYTSQITQRQQCQVTKLQPANVTEESAQHDVPDAFNKNAFACTSLTGTLPDLKLTVQVSNVSKADEGEWRLELTNDVGTGHLDFRLLVTERNSTKNESVVEKVTIQYYTDPPTTAQTTSVNYDVNSDDSSDQGNGGTGDGVVAAVIIVVLLIIIVVIVVILYKRREQKPAKEDDYTSTPLSE